MKTHQIKANKLIQSFGATRKAKLELKNGVCGLYDSNQKELAIIEVPANSDTIIIHCLIQALGKDIPPVLLQQFLLLNSEISAMQGCWLGLDEVSNLRLCYTMHLDRTDEMHFCDTLNGFMKQVGELRDFTDELLLKSLTA